MKDKRRVVVEMPNEMISFLEEKAKSTGVGNVSAVVRMIIKQQQEEARANA